jgi:hypothetical protein
MMNLTMNRPWPPPLAELQPHREAVRPDGIVTAAD